jgi:16S rRNA G1207 methylase RsmC
MHIHFDHAFGELTLRRFPKGAQHKSLQAWDATDSYLLNTFAEDILPNFGTDSTINILIANDDFGALCCALVQHFSHSTINYAIYSWSDSLISQQATLANLAENELDDQHIHWLDSLSAPPVTIDVALLKLPRSMPFLADQLQRLRPQLQADSIVLAGAKMQAVSNNVQALFTRYIGDNRTGLAWKKSRLLSATVASETATTAADTDVVHWDVPKLALTIHNYPNVFARQHLDIGARFMLRHLDPCTGKHIIDLGCGNGVLGCAALQANPDAQVTFVDESKHALASAQASVAHNFPDKLSQCEFWQNNCLSYYGKRPPADLILCNPPFHQNNTITEHIAFQMFHDAFFALVPGGELRVVANRHLTYGKVLKKRFGGFKVVANSEKFTILSTFKKG